MTLKTKHKPLKIKILGETWKVYYLTCGEYVAQFDEHSDAITHYNHPTGYRVISFRLKRFTQVAVKHELMHAYFSYTDMRGCTYAQTEEAMCEKLSRYWRALERNTRRIVKSKP